MKADGGVLITQGCYIFSDSSATPSQCDISSPMNVYSSYQGTPPLGITYIYPDYNTNFTTLAINQSQPLISNLPVFCGAHEFTVETYFTSLPTPQFYTVIWAFYNPLNNDNLMASVRMDTDGVRSLVPSTSYTVSYNNGLISYPVPGVNSPGSTPSPTVTENATNTAFKVLVSYYRNNTNTALTLRGYYH